MSSEESVVPEDFDLESQLRATSVTPAEERERCPECESTKLQYRDLSAFGAPPAEGDEDIRCGRCGALFDEWETVTWGDDDD